MEAPKARGSKLLPANAYKKLAPGEVYHPIVPPEDRRPEVTRWSIGLGVIMVIIFTAAATYISLRAGSGIEAAIPIAILAIFFGKMRRNPSTILENVMVQSVGQASGVVAAGATFVVPALYLNSLDAQWWQIFLACLIGGTLGTVLIIPLRRHFVRERHGDLPFPEGTAINEVLVTGESTAGGAGKVLLLSFALGAGYDFLADAMHLWNSGINTTAMLGSAGEIAADYGIEVSIAGIAALFGLGYVIGLKYSAIIAAGSVLAMLVVVPLLSLVGDKLATQPLPPGTAPSDLFALLRGLLTGGAADPHTALGPAYAASTATLAYAGNTIHLASAAPGTLFGAVVRPVGIGAIAVSAIIGILRMGKIVVGSVALGFKGFGKKGAVAATDVRTDRDMSPKTVLQIELGAALLMGILFFVVAMVTPAPDGQPAYTVLQGLTFAVVGMVAGFLLAFLFTPVAAEAIATVGTNPVSGMTLITVVSAIGILIAVGLKGQVGMIVALIVGTAVCTALSVSGALISDFKVGYWIGSTPLNQQKWKFLGLAVAALAVAFVIPLMDASYHFLVTDPVTGGLVSNTKVLPAPQANMIAAVSKGLMEDPANQPWLLYGLGGLVAITLFLAGVPMLAFALGIYLPISINLAVLAGAFCGWLIGKSGGSAEVREARQQQGPLIASGLMAGAAIIGIITAVLRLPDVGAPIRFLSVGVAFELKGDLLEHTAAPWYEGMQGQVTSIVMFALLGVACYLLARVGAGWYLRGLQEQERAEK